MNKRSFARSLLSAVVGILMLSAFNSTSLKNTVGPASVQWKKCWGQGQWYGGCIEIKVSVSSHSNITDVSSLADKIEVKLNVDSTGLVFRFPRELEQAQFQIVSKFVSAIKPNSKNTRITISPANYTIPKTLKVEVKSQLIMHR